MGDTEIKLLSILIAATPDREEMMNALIASIKAQPGADRVEVLFDMSPHKDDGGPTRGAKRNKLLWNARGEYICYVDSDDKVSDGTEHAPYVPSIIHAIEEGPVFDTELPTPDAEIAVYSPHIGDRVRPDCVGITGEIRFHDDPHLLFYHSMRHSLDWWDDAATAEPGKAQYYRTPNHLNPVKRTLALRAEFADMQWSEDHDYARRLHKIIATESPIDHPIYYYCK